MEDKTILPEHFLQNLKELSASPYERSTISEAVFRHKWLPLFNATSHEDLAPIGDWVQQVALNPFREVDVIKDGEVVFVVPPMLNSQIDVFKDGTDIYLDTELDSIRREAAHFAIKGERQFEDKIIGNLKVDVEPSDYSQRMDKIFEYYGIPRAKRLEAPGTTSKTSAADETMPEVSFEDY